MNLLMIFICVKNVNKMQLQLFVKLVMQNYVNNVVNKYTDFK